MLSKKTMDAINVIKNAFELVEKNAGNYQSMEELLDAAVEKTAKEDGHKDNSVVMSHITRGLNLTGDGAKKKVYKMIEDACMGKEINHNCDELLDCLRDYRNSNDDSEEEIRRVYLDIFK